jgi:alcohol dehydrogenase
MLEKLSIQVLTKGDSMSHHMERAKQLLIDWKGDNYAFGVNVLGRTGGFAASLGKKALVVVADLGAAWIQPVYEKVAASLDSNGVSYTSILGAGPNAPREDVYRIANEISKNKPSVIVVVGGGSTIDAAKCASVLATYTTAQVCEHLGATPALASTVEPYFGGDLVTKIKNATKVSPAPVVAVQTAASSGAHLTKYSNITDPVSGQKKLIVDMAVVPPRAVFDYGITAGTPKGLTLDGGLDGFAHMWEVFMGATGKDYYQKIREITVEGIGLVLEYLPKALNNPNDTEAREALGIATDLGGYAIMIGGTNGGHLGSFSLIDVTSHGRACAILNPYYTVLFSPAIQDQLRTIGAVFKAAGYITKNIETLSGRELGQAVADGMIAFSRALNFPVNLSEAGATAAHIDRMISAAKNPQLASKLMNMPIPMDPARGDVENYMKPVLDAALSGNFSRIRLIGS